MKEPYFSARAVLPPVRTKEKNQEILRKTNNWPSGVFLDVSGQEKAVVL